MRLYLSSFRIGNCPERLLAMAAGASRVAIIANSLDAIASAERADALERDRLAITELGFDADELDLRDYFTDGSRVSTDSSRVSTDSSRVGADLRGYDVLWVRGGNTFVLRHALARSGADTELISMLAEDAIVYAGYSAGVCVLAPSLHGLEIVDEPDAVSQTYGDPPIWDGLAILDYAVVPHFDSPLHFESERCGQVAEHYRATGVAHRTLRDGEVLVIDGADVSVCG